MTAVMRLETLPGRTRAGRDKLCSLHVKLRTGDIVIKRAHRLSRAIDVALDRLKVNGRNRAPQTACGRLKPQLRPGPDHWVARFESVPLQA